MRFLDMEGGAHIFTDPTEIADRYHRALKEHLEALDQIVLESGVDYHRVNIEGSCEQALMDFLVRRHQMRGAR